MKQTKLFDEIFNYDCFRFCKHNDDSKRQRVATILDKLITLTIEEVEVGFNNTLVNS